jgi:molecular chaperone DnaK (HSP70)
MAEKVTNQDSIDKDESQVVIRLTSSLGMGLPEGQFRVFLPKGSRLPCEASGRFLTRLKEYNKARIRVFMGESEYVEDNIFLGELGLDGIRLNKDGQALIDVVFQADINNMLHVQIKDEPGKKSSTVILPIPSDEGFQYRGEPPDGKKPKPRRTSSVETDFLMEKITLLEEKLQDMEKELMHRYKSEMDTKASDTPKEKDDKENQG